MINFYDPNLASQPNKYTTISEDGLWIYETKVKNYKKDLQYLNKLLIGALTQFERTAGSTDALVAKMWRENLESSDGSLMSLYDDGRGPFVENPPETRVGSWEYLHDLILKRTRPTLDSTETLYEARVFSEKVVDFYTKFFGKFNDYYMMARQLNNFECRYLPVFKQLYLLADGMLDGRIFLYFDVKTTELYNSMTSIFQRISDLPNVDPTAPNADTIQIIQTDFNLAFNLYKTNITNGTIEFKEIINKGSRFLDSLVSGVHVISTANIVLTARNEDNSMLEAQSKSLVGVSNVDPNSPYLENETRNQLLEEIKVKSIVTQIAIALKPSLRSDYSNFEYIMSNTVAVGLTQTGNLQALEDLIITIGLYGE